FTETTATVADGTVTFQWQSSTTGAAGPFTDIAGETLSTYNSPALTQDTWFQRVDTSTLNTIACTATTNVIAVTVNNITAGVIAADETICEGGDPIAFTETTATVADGTVTFQWQSSTTGAAGPFTDIAGATTATFDSGVLTQDTWFQRVDTSTLNTIACTATTNVIAVTVNNITAGVIAADETICEGGDPIAFTETTATVADGTVTFQWQSSTTGAAGPFADIAGATTATFDSGVLTQDTWFQRVDTSTLNTIACTATTNVIAVTVNNITAGVIAADETICEGGDPIAFTETTATVADGMVTFQWQSSTTGAAGPFADIAGATTATFDSGVLTQDTWFQRVDTSTLNTVACTATTNVIAVTVNNITAGVIAADETICEGGDPIAFTETTATVADGTVTFQWQSSTTGAAGPFTDIAGATTATFDSGVLTQDTWFQRVDTSTLNTIACTATTNVIAVTVNNITAGVIAADETICEGGDPIAFTETTATVADGTVTFQWQSSTTGAAGPFTDIAGETLSTYNSPALTQDTWFQRVDTSTLNTIACTATTNVIAVTVNNITAGVIAADETICEGGDPIAFTETTATVADGTVTFQWQSSTTGAAGPFADIAGETLSTYNSPALTQDTWFQRVDTSTLNTIACTATTNVIAVTVNNITAGVIAADETICEGGDPIAFTETTATVADGTVTFQWQSSTTGAAGPFADIAGATTATFDSGVLTQDTWFQRVDTSTLNTVACTATTNVVAVTVNNITAGVIAADETICEGGDPIAFTETTATVADGTVTFQWQSSTTGAAGPFTDIAGATTATFDSGVLTQDTWFQRVDTSTLNTIACTATTNVIAVTVNNITAGVIAADETICEGGDPIAFTETTATVADGTVTFQWQSSTTGAAGPFADIAGATTATFDSGVLTQDTWFQRVDTSTLNTIACTATTNVVAVTVNNITAGVIAADETICEGGDPIAFTETTATVADGTVTFQWQSSTTGAAGPFADIAGATTATFDSGVLTQDTWFQRVDTSTLNTIACTATTNVIAVTVNNITAGVIAADQIIVSGEDPVAFSETTATVADGAVTFQWQSSTTGAAGPFTDLVGETNATYDSPPLFQDHWFQRVDTSTLNTIACTAITNVVSIILDSDGDGIPDATDLDDDNDGITDEEEQNGDATLDSDGDGVIDRLDLDSDGDGVYDVFESGHGQLDMDGDGRLEGPFSSDGIPDVVQDDPDSGVVNYAVQDTDGDGVDDFQDIDDDGDNVLTVDENPNPDSDLNPDTGDTQDTDMDGIADYLDVDDDNDGVDTVYEDYDGDDDPLNQDTDGDGIPDYLDMDDDGDGVDTQYEGVDPDGDGNPNTGDTLDTDCILDNNCDNIPDYLDTDDDGDGFLTEDESPDQNGDGNPDDALDTDGNGTPDYLEPNDNTVPEGEDGITVFTGMSPNGDGVNDVFVIQGIQNLENRLEIFNRWGIKVYESNNYGRDDNFFRGISTTSSTVERQDQLPVGTYYYVLEYVLESGERKSRAGYLYINR
ncbi:gliding motility-associated C-terminal domain-containing protein, partial [Aquimarina mytili]